MADIKEKLCNEFNLNPSSIRLLFNGTRIHDNDTSKSLEIKSGDVIEVFTEMRGGGKKNKNPFNKRKETLDDAEKILNYLDTLGDDSNQDLLKSNKDKNHDEELDSKCTLETKDNNQPLIYPEQTICGNNTEEKTIETSDKLKEGKIVEVDGLNIEEALICQGKPLRKLVTNMCPQELSSANTQSDAEDPLSNCKINEIKTPQKRKKYLERFQWKTPSPLMKQSKVKKETMTRLSLAVHLYAEEYLGGIKGLQNMRLEETHFQEILDFAGPGTMYNLINGRTPYQYKCLWRNSAKSKDIFRGHPSFGFENERGRHDSSIQYCPFQHCSKETVNSMSPLEIDIRLVTPKRGKDIHPKPNKTLSRKLFNDNRIKTPLKSLVEPITEGIEKNDDMGETLEQSPTKQKLLSRKRKLLDEMEDLTKKLGKYEANQSENKRKDISSNQLSLLKCQSNGCDKLFTSMFGLLKHMRSHHSEEDIAKKVEICKICGKEVKYIDKHIRTVHKNVMGEENCTVCLKNVKKSEMKSHRGKCIFCPICGKKEKKRLRLVEHITKCEQKGKLIPVQMEPLDLRSPLKWDTQKEESTSCSMVLPLNTSNNLIPNQIQSYQPFPASDPLQPSCTYSNPIDPSLTQWPPSEHIAIEDSRLELPKSSKHKEVTRRSHEITEDNRSLQKEGDETESRSRNDFLQKRDKFPFDTYEEEEYNSEFEENDTPEYTMKRRQNKDSLEIRLREADGIINKAAEGDTEITTQFRAFMLSTTCGENKDDFEPSTVGIYTRTIEKDLLKAFHELFDPFDSRWLLDCTTSKEYTFEGEAPAHVSPTEPVYLTARVLRKALERYKNSDSGNQRATLLAATVQFMLFIELHFNNKLNLYGRTPLDNVISYHNGVKSFIESTKIWKTCNKDKKRTLKNNKILKEYENPNFEAEILENFQKYTKSKQRLDRIGKILKFARNNTMKPTNKEFTEIGNIMMGEIVISTGVRPVVVYRLPVRNYVAKKIGFDPRDVTPDDCVIDEEQENSKIYRRLNPNLPPKHLACKHQLIKKVAICPENCDDRCEPQGFNILCDWDKTFGSRGYSYLHIAKPINDLMGMYNIIKKRFFEGKKPSRYTEDSWLDCDKTAFFLQSSGNPFKAIDMQHVSEDMRVDVTAYSFRRIVSTWALSHVSQDIRDAEGHALQHSLRVGKDHYKQNNELQPQKLTQTYIEEECILPKKLRAEIQKTEVIVREHIAETDSHRQKQQHQSMLEESNAKKKLLQQRKPLGPKHRVLGEDRKEFTALVQEATGIDIERTHKQWKPCPWRNFIVRTVCGTSNETGDKLRDIWLKIYKGDLKWGVRDDRLRAKENNWPRKDSNAYLQKKDRSSWIAFAILRSIQTVSRANTKKSFVNIIKNAKIEKK